MVVEKDFIQTEAGFIPKDWDVKKLGEISDVIGGGTPSTAVNKYWEGEINWFTPTEVGYEKYLFESKRKLTHAGLSNSSARILQPGTILMTSRAGIGDLGILKVEAATNQGFQSLFPFTTIDNEFLYYLMLTKKNVLLQNASGSTFLEVSPSKVKSIFLAIPPKKEQTAIATALSDMDALIAQTEKLIKKKKAIKQGVMQELLKPKEGWVTKKLGEIVEIKKGQLITDSTRIQGEIPVIAGGKTPAYFHNQANRMGKTITISGSGASAGYVSFHSMPIFASDCSTIEESDKYSIEFLFFILQNIQDRIYKMQTGGAQPHIHPSDLYPIHVSIPNKEEQCRIATIISDVNLNILKLEEKFQKLKLQKQGMMQALLTGKIRLV